MPLNLYNDTLRFSDGGITATPNWNNTDTWLSWDIDSLGAGLLEYEYTFHTSGNYVTHLLLEVTEGALAGDFSD